MTQKRFFDRPLSLFGLGGGFREVALAAKRAEELGFAGVAFGEHHGQRVMDFPDPLIVLAGLAGVTHSMTLSTSISLLPLYNPVEFAERVATIDQMSGGRVEIGVGAGYQKIDFATFGVPYASRFRRLEEGIQSVKTLWNETPASFAGDEFSFEDVRLWPRPVRPGGPPILLSAWSEAGIKRAATIGDGWIIDPVQHVSMVEPWRDLYREHSPSGKIILMRNCVITDSDREFEMDCRRRLQANYEYYFRRGAIDQLDPVLTDIESLGDDRLMEGRVLWGSVTEVSETLQDWIGLLQPDEVQLCLSGIPSVHLERQIDRISSLLT